MSTTEEQVQRVMRALADKPDLLFQVMKELHRERVLSPWECNGDTYHRYDPEGNILAQVWFDQEPYEWRWRVPTLGREGNGDLLLDAEAFADAVLRDNGWLLS